LDQPMPSTLAANLELRGVGRRFHAQYAELPARTAVLSLTNRRHEVPIHSVPGCCNFDQRQFVLPYRWRPLSASHWYPLPLSTGTAPCASRRLATASWREVMASDRLTTVSCRSTT